MGEGGHLFYYSDQQRGRPYNFGKYFDSITLTIVYPVGFHRGGKSQQIEIGYR